VLVSALYGIAFLYCFYVGRFRVFVRVMEGLTCVLCVHTKIYAGIKYGTVGKDYSA
jgi:hypothetical protein